MSDNRFTQHKRTSVSEMRPYEVGEDMTGISVSDADKQLATLEGGWIARNPKNHADQWYVAKKYYEDNLEPVQIQGNALDASKPLTFGEEAVGLLFNPSGDDAVGQAKKKMAEAIDQMEDFRNNPATNVGAKRHASVAITDLETAQMRMVKALTWKIKK